MHIDSQKKMAYCHHREFVTEFLASCVKTGITFCHALHEHYFCPLSALARELVSTENKDGGTPVSFFILERILKLTDGSSVIHRDGSSVSSISNIFRE